MRNLLERDVVNTSSPLECALEHGRTELRDERIRTRGLLLCPEVRQRTWFWFAVGWQRQEAGMCVVQVRVSPLLFRPCSVTASGPMRRPAAGSLFCFATHPPGYGFHLRRTLRKCRASALGVAPTR